MKKLINRYRYERTFEERVDENGRISYPYHDGNLYACYENRDYKTKMYKEDLPEYYCNVWRYSGNWDVISAKGVKGLYYKWVKENHFMKDSLLYVSYTDEIEPYCETYTYDGKEIKSIFSSYRNAEQMVFGHSIFKFLAYVHKYSDYDLSIIRSEVKEQCEWLKEHEPFHAPDLEDCNDYGEWFDQKIKKAFEDDN